MMRMAQLSAGQERHRAGAWSGECNVLGAADRWINLLEYMETNGEGICRWRKSLKSELIVFRELKMSSDRDAVVCLRKLLAKKQRNWRNL